MLAFITSLRHPQNSADYSRVEKLLQQTLVSVCSQTSDDFIVVVVGNKRPSFDLPPKVEFVQVDFPAPAPPDGPRTARAPFVWDKGTKIAAGVRVARKFSPDHVMIFDADDYVSRDLAHFASTNRDGGGWVVRDGWMYSYSRQVLKSVRDFNRTCGTSFIMPFAAYDAPDLEKAETQEDLAKAVGERLDRVLGAHRDALEWFREQGWNVRPLPFRGAVYNVDTGENHSGKESSGVARPVGRRLAEQYKLPVSRPLISRVWSAVGPRALGETLIGRVRSLRGARPLRVGRRP